MSPVGGIAARALVVAVLVVGGAGCGGSERPIVLAAASLRAAGIEDATGARVSYASSGVVAQQVRRGADADVVVVADPAVMDGLRTDGLTGDATVVARNRLAILVPAGRSVPGLAELASPGVRIAIGGAGSPLGAYTRTAIARAAAPNVLDNVVTEEPDAAGVVGKVASGAVDAGIGYASDLTGGRVAGTVLPEALQPEILYVAAMTRNARRAAAGGRVLEWLTGPQGRLRLERAGFAAP